MRGRFAEKRILRINWQFGNDIVGRMRLLHHSDLVALVAKVRLAAEPEKRGQMAKPRKIVFAYRRGQAQMGGKIMRVDQLSQIAAQFLPADAYSVSTVFVPRERHLRQTRELISACADAVVIFHKSAASNMSAEGRHALRKVAAGICVDHLDIVVGPLETGFFDVHIAASRKAEAELVQNLSALAPVPGTQVRHLRHHADPSLGGQTCSRLRSLKPGYFGLPGNLDDPSVLPSETIIPDYEPTNLRGFLDALPRANFHFCVRTPFAKEGLEILPAKPFTKGFNAAAVRANVLVNRQVHDAAHYLGEDYPFMIADSTATDIHQGFARAKEAFGTSEWTLGLDRMADMAARVAPREVALELKQIVDLFR